METLDVEVTDLAQAKFLALLDSNGLDGAQMAVRIEVKPGGCSGYIYDLHFSDESHSDDVERHFGALRVVSDIESARLLSGATVTYEDGLNSSGFAVDNPNASRGCGCGKSFC